jgi:Family of unknown function (DUF6603)
LTTPTRCEEDRPECGAGRAAHREGAVLSEPVGFADAALGAVLDALSPLEAAVEDAAVLLELLDELGWRIPDAQVDLTALSALSAIATDIESAATALEAYREADGDDDQQLADVGTAVVGLLADVAQLATKPLPTTLPEPLSTQAFWTAMAEELPGYLIADYLRRRQPLVFSLLHAIGVIDKVAAAQDANRADGQLVDVLRWDRIEKLVSDPRGLFVDVYGWGGTLLYQPLVERLRDALRALGVTALVAGPGQERLEQQYGTGTVLPSPIPMLRVPLYVGDTPSDPYVEVGIDVLPIPAAKGSATPVGLLVSPYATAALSVSLALTDELSLEFAGTADASGATGLIVRPNGFDLFLDGTAITGDVSGTVVWAPPAPRTIIGDPAATGASIAGASFGIELMTQGTNLEDAKVKLGIDKLHLHVDFGQGDSFLAKIASGVKVDAELDGALVWSWKHGFAFEGSPRLEISIPLNLVLGPIELVTLTLGAGVDHGKITISGAIDASGEIGPVQVEVTKVGLAMVLEPDPNGSFGGLHPVFRFKPPTGLGLAVEAGPVGGGGFIEFDEVAEQYAGGLELSLEILDLTAIGLLNTKMPDGTKGFSLLVIVSAEFSPIQLGYGFTLNGVGGLVGINRGMNVDFIRSGLKDGTLDSIRFPHDIVANAPKIISDLRNAFPVQEGEYVFGPMVAIGWGESIIELQLGLVLQLPHPLRLMILGTLIIALPEPDPDESVLMLKLDLLGIIDFDTGEVSFDGALNESHIATFPLTGQMAMRASFGSNPTFALSAGGFNPRFQPPPAFPSLDRMAIALCTGDNPRLRLEAYFAVTTNTLQLGAHLDLYAEKDLGFLGDFTIQGYLGFDGLLKFSPLSFIVEIAAGLTLKRDGDAFVSVSLSMTLSGPSPWHAYGSAEFKVLGASKSIDFDLTVGEAAPAAPLPPVDPLPLLVAALQDVRNWAAGAPGQTLVTLRAQPAGSTKVLVHPLGSMTVRQRVLPLDFQVAAFGHHDLAGSLTTFTIASVKAGTQSLDSGDVRDRFAPGDFLKLTDDEKLARPSFEELKAGVSVGTAPIAAGTRAQANFGYKQYILTDQEAVPVPGVHHLAPDDLHTLARSGSAAKAPVRSTGAARYAGTNAPVTVQGMPYAVSRKDALGAAAGVQATGTTYAEADAARRAAGDPDSLQVVGAHEVT